MKKLYFFVFSAILCTALFIYYQSHKDPTLIYASTEEELENEEEKEGYDGPAERDALEFEKIKDPALGYAPVERLQNALDYTVNQKSALRLSRYSASLDWIERGPIYDSVGPSNGNGRGGGVGVTKAYTSGRMRAVLIDTLNDPTGNTVFAGGVAGGLWRTTNFLSSVPNWQPINDRFDNLALTSLAQDPTNPSVMYFSTGEATSNADATFGAGVWKSTDKGLTWVQLPSTKSFIRTYKLATDKSGNVYLATLATTTPVAQPYGLYRSKDDGNTWVNITPIPSRRNNSNATCTDIEISADGRLHASFGYRGATVSHQFTDNPETVTPDAGWVRSVGIRASATATTAIRAELAVQGNVVYAVTVNSANNADSTYKSIDGGATFVKQNTAGYPSGILNTQGWYNIILGINPTNANEIVLGGLDAYRSTNSGATFTRFTAWAGNGQYVHADMHFIQWWMIGGESRMIIASDGGLFISRDNGATWTDRNRNLGIKQFYAAAIHPAAGSNYLLAGAQDNGVHSLKNPGLSYSTEVTGGDGAFVHINQKNPQVQFGSYVFNQYRRSTNGGATWSSVNFSGSNGLFINPYDYDDTKNIMYASWKADTVLRWLNANTSTSANLLGLPGLGTPTSFKVSPYTTDRLYVGSNAGRLFRVDNAAGGTPVITNITGSTFPSGFLNTINVGTNENVLVAVFTNYGINNVWYSTNAGTSWSPIDGNLPDMPIRWAVFFPGQDDKILLATDAGVYATQKVSGTNTVWTPDLSFPTVRTNMLKIRESDKAVVASTHGRGLFTAVMPSSFGPEVNFTAPSLTVTESTGTSTACRGYKDFTVNVSLDVPATGNTQAVINMLGNATAQKGIDFDFTTNGDFSSPSNTLTFASGTSSEQPVTVRIYDDAEAESMEGFVLELKVEGNTNAILGYNKAFSVTIKDIDRAPMVTGQYSYTVGSYNGDAIATSPFASNKLKHKMQSLYTADELRAAGVLPNASISAMTVEVLVKNSNKPFKGFTVAMANTSTTTLSAGFTNAAFTNVYSGDYTTAVGENTINFNTSFVWDGTSNIAVQYCFDNVPDSGLTGVDVMAANLTPLGVGVRASTYSNHLVGTPVTPAMQLAGCSLPAALVSDARINATFHATGGNAIVTQVNTEKTEYLNKTNYLNYYSTNNVVLARVKNLSDNDFACTKVMIDRAGTAATRFWNSTKNNMLMDKTHHVTSTGRYQTGAYEVTLYFTKEEKEGWEAATGQRWNDIQLIRTAGKISEVTPSNAQVNNGGAVKEVVAPVKGTYGTGYTLTGTFNGFGGIGAGIPGKQFTVLIVKANGNMGNGNGNTNSRSSAPSGVKVEWSTSSETGSSYFEVEKSYDGTNFKKIGTVKASGNSNSISNYNFIDAENAQLNYYRITLYHTDKSVLVSNTVLVRNDAAIQQMFVLTNPFRNDIRLRFAKMPETPVTVRMFDMQGRLVKSYTSPAGSIMLRMDLNTMKVLSSGIYDLDVTIDGKQFKSKLVKE